MWRCGECGQWWERREEEVWPDQVLIWYEPIDEFDDLIEW